MGIGPDHAGPMGGLFNRGGLPRVVRGQLRSRLSDGKTLAQIAKAEGKSVDGLVQAMLDDADEKLADAVAAGKLTEAEADKIRADWKERISDFVNGETPFGFHLGFDKDGFGFHEQFEFRSGGPGQPSSSAPRAAAAFRNEEGVRLFVTPDHGVVVPETSLASACR